MPSELDETRRLPRVEIQRKAELAEILTQVAEALRDKGYDPIFNITGYLLSGDPAYITSNKNARSLIRKLERDEILQELVRSYLDSHGIQSSGTDGH
jgi:uncharacterized protein (UPF0297 family)